ncbi:MAG: secretin N-terminal domain-containing protein [Pseudomonadota bacterium]
MQIKKIDKKNLANSRFSWIFSMLFYSSFCLLVFGCSSVGMMSDTLKRTKSGDLTHADPIDTHLDLTRDEYMKMAKAKGAKDDVKVSVEQAPPPIPKIADILAAPRPPKIGETKLVSIAVTDDVPLKDVMLELSRLANVDVELDAGISGGVSFVAKDKPFNEVVDRICNLAGLRYTMKNGVLRVERDNPYVKTYALNFLNMERDSSSSVSVNTSVGGASGGGSSGGSSSSSSSSSGSSSGGSNGSSASMSSKTTGDFWKSMESGIQQIIAFQENTKVSTTTLQAEIAPVASTPPPADPTAAAPAIPTPAASPVAATASSSPASAATTSNKSGYTINRQAGILTFNGTQKQHEMMEIYLNELKKSASAQVLIEAKIIEVDLYDKYASGVKWDLISTRLGKSFGDIKNLSFTGKDGKPSTLNGSTFNSLTNGVFNVPLSADSTGALTMLEEFGTTRTLSSPRLHAINNQLSELTFTTNHVYFEVTATQTDATFDSNGKQLTAAKITFTSTSKSTPIGILMTIMPSVDVDNNEVTLAVRPTLTTLKGEVNDPAFDLSLTSFYGGKIPDDAKNIHSATPETQVRELDSTLRLKSGQTMVIGGLMQQESENNDNGVPGMAGLPIIGNLFKSVAKTTHNKELVLLIKASIVDSRGSINGVDKNILNKFSDDPRPVSF